MRDLPRAACLMRDLRRAACPRLGPQPAECLMRAAEPAPLCSSATIRWQECTPRVCRAKCVNSTLRVSVLPLPPWEPRSAARGMHGATMEWSVASVRATTRCVYKAEHAQIVCYARQAQTADLRLPRAERACLCPSHPPTLDSQGIANDASIRMADAKHQGHL
jgi:hypothetical protein